jgi:hypothetical protein
MNEQGREPRGDTTRDRERAEGDLTWNLQLSWVPPCIFGAIRAPPEQGHKAHPAEVQRVGRCSLTQGEAALMKRLSELKKGYLDWEVRFQEVGRPSDTKSKIVTKGPRYQVDVQECKSGVQP